MTIDALVHTTLELHAAIASKQLNAIDQKVQQIIKQYHALNPESHEIEELYLKEKIATDLSDHKKMVHDFSIYEITPELQAKLKNLEAVIVKNVSTAAPDVELERRIDRHDRFTKACTFLDVYGSDLSKLKNILKEGPIDFDTIYLPVSDTSSLPLFSYILKNASNDQLLSFLLQNGMRVNSQNAQEAASILHYLIPAVRFKTVHYSPALFEALLRAGLDLNIILPDERYSVRLTSPATLGEMLLSHALSGGHHSVMEDLIYHGAGEMDNDILLIASEIGASGYNFWFEAFSIRGEMLEKMQKDLPTTERKPLRDFSVAEREMLANLCRKTQRFHVACYNRNWSVDRDVEERRDIHDAFIEACLNGRLDEAEKLFAHDIDINANLVEVISPRWDGDDYCPLLNHACLKGDVKLVEFLLSHGAKCNIGSSDEGAKWLPPILECAISKIPNKSQILALLLKAGANPNDKCINRYWASHGHLREAFLKKNVNKGALLDDLSSIGMDINLPDRRGKTWFDHLFAELSIDRDDDDYFEKIDEDLYNELATLLIYYGAKVSEAQLKAINENEKFKPLRDAIKLHDAARTEFINDQLKELQALRPLSMDLINLITRYLNEELTPQENAQVARKIRMY